MKIKKIVSKYMIAITLMLVVVILVFVTLSHILTEQRQAKERAQSVFLEVESILKENQKELEEVEKQYSQTCLYNAETIAYIIENENVVLEDVEELKKIAKMVQVDEIHIFNKTGEIYAGTHPDYYGLNMNSGEQVGFFLPMLEDKALKLCQEITPNTAEGKLVQYSAVWSKNGEFIVQVGMEPINVFKATEKNELSHIFSHLRVDAGVDLYAIEKDTGEIVGSTASEDIGVHCSEIGFDYEKIVKKSESVHMTIKGANSYCVFTEMGELWIGRVVSNDILYDEIPLSVAEIGLGIVVAASILGFAVIWYINKYVIKGIHNINDKLSLIGEGNLNESVDENSSLEFSELSSHINSMVNRLLLTTDKMSYVLNRTNMNIGVYEYNDKMEDVRFTERVPRILKLDLREEKKLRTDKRLFSECIDKIKNNPYSDEEKDIFHFKNRYIRLEEINENGNVLGIIIDITDSIERRVKLEMERDRDVLTGLYNRRGLENILSKLFKEPDMLGYGALIMIDTDGLKGINDNYGHEKGDIFLRKVAGVIGTYGVKKGVSARLGGDEFVLFLYGYEKEEDVLNDINTLKYIQEKSSVHLDMNLIVPLSFSFGYVLTKGNADYESMLQEADELMYINKRERKENR